MTDEEKRKARNRAASERYRQNHPGYNADKTRRYRANNPEAAAATANLCAKRYYQEHKHDPQFQQQRRAISKEWARNQYGNDGWATYRAAHCRRGNKRLGLGPTDVTKEFVLTLFEQQGGRCYYTGIPFRMQDGIFAPSLDRKVPLLGYFQTNVVLCLAGVNYAKSDSSLDEFEEFLSALRRP